MPRVNKQCGVNLVMAWRHCVKPLLKLRFPDIPKKSRKAAMHQRHLRHMYDASLTNMVVSRRWVNLQPTSYTVCALMDLSVTVQDSSVFIHTQTHTHIHTNVPDE